MKKSTFEHVSVPAVNWAKRVRKQVGLACNDGTRTVQHHKDDADLNKIVRDFGVTGKMPAPVRVPTYGDFTEVTDYQSAFEAVANAEKSFNQLPSQLREKLKHDPQRFLEYAADPRNLEEMRSMGMITQTEPPPPPKPETKEG